MQQEYDISVVARSERPAGVYTVTISAAGAPVSTHEVTVDEEFLELLSEPDDAAAVQRSLAWLLARESPQAILGRFDLRDISRYFPEYPAALS